MLLLYCVSAMVDSFCNGMSGMSNHQGFVEEEEEASRTTKPYDCVHLHITPFFKLKVSFYFCNISE
jgi:hypothetical protein